LDDHLIINIKGNMLQVSLSKPQLKLNLVNIAI